MSTHSKKPSDTPSGEPSPRAIVAELLRAVGATPADDLLDRVFAEHQQTPCLVAIIHGHRPFHRRCGSLCSFVAGNAVDKPGSFYLGVTCPKCLRDLMEGEIEYELNPKSPSVHG